MTESGCQCQCLETGCAGRRGKIDLHGSTWSYGAGCRCAECVGANTRKTLRQRKDTNGRTRESAHHHAQEWTGPELEIVTRPGLTAREAAALVGRTMCAVKNARFKCEHDPKYMAKLGRSS